MRYFVTEPIPNGYAYYDVRDHESNLGENFSVATFWRDMPGVTAGRFRGWSLRRSR